MGVIEPELFPAPAQRSDLTGEMLVSVAATQTLCLWPTHTGTIKALVCPASHLLPVVTHKVKVCQVICQLSCDSTRFPNQL